VTRHTPDAEAIAAAFVDAINRGDHDEAARHLAEDAEIVLPGGTLHGREAWLESRRRQQPPEQL
jgi:hypothetical protein